MQNKEVYKLYVVHTGIVMCKHRLHVYNICIHTPLERWEEDVQELSREFWSGKFWSGGPKFSVENWSGRTDFSGKMVRLWKIGPNNKRFSYKRLLRIKHPVQCLLT